MRITRQLFGHVSTVRRRLLGTWAGALAAFLALATSASAQSGGSAHDCFWSLPPKGDLDNGLSQDQNARYWLAEYALPPGASIVFHGAYPHGRFMSFTAYNSRFGIAGFALDSQIAPDPRSSNPFVAGGDRRARKRDYTVRLVPGVVPSNPAPNTIYASDGGRPLYSGYLIYRLYLPDRGRDATGGAGLPTASVVLPGGQTVTGTQACALFNSTPSDVPHQIPPDAPGPTLALQHPGVDPPRWFVYKNLLSAMGERYTPGTPAEAVSPPSSDADYLTSPGQAYMFTETNRAFGPVLVLSFKRAPTTPTTLDGDARTRSGQMRYWSVCQDDPTTSTYIACMNDERAVRTRGGGATFVISRPQDRPPNATARCGVNWLPWGPSQHGEILLRNMLPSPRFHDAIQDIPPGGDIAPAMGRYFPRPSYTTSAAFARRGCAAGRKQVTSSTAATSASSSRR